MTLAQSSGSASTPNAPLPCRRSDANGPVDHCPAYFQNQIGLVGSSLQPNFLKSQTMIPKGPALETQLAVITNDLDTALDIANFRSSDSSSDTDPRAPVKPNRHTDAVLGSRFPRPWC